MAFELVEKSRAEFINNKTFAANYELVTMGAASSALVRLNWKTPEVVAPDLVEFCRGFISLHTQLRSKLNVPPAIILTFPNQSPKAGGFNYIGTLLRVLPQIPQFLAYARYLRTNEIFVAVLNAPESGMRLVRQFNPKAQNYPFENQALARYQAWAERYLGNSHY